MFENSASIKKGLYIVPTPIGNLGDITLRAIEILKKSDFILCEDTRTSMILLKKYQINSKLISNHKFNEKKNLAKILNFLKSGSIISLISDAGTPCLSDPGSILINECLKTDISVIPLPGASAITSAISVSGFSEKFFFYGFFPEKLKNIDEDLRLLSNLDSSLVFFISAKKFNKIVPEIKKFFFDRKILICREMSKFYEEFIRCSVNKLKVFNQQPKGELTIVISEKKGRKKSYQELSESDKRIIKNMISKVSIKEITNLIHSNNKVSKKKIYNYCLKLKNEN
tara:strand:- start:1249 stop:2100 length:852 start_codon:yes stop_codon:yes gene_type:complete